MDKQLTNTPKFDYICRETMTEMDLQTSLEEAKLAVDYFFNNKFTEAKQLLEPW